MVRASDIGPPTSGLRGSSRLTTPGIMSSNSMYKVHTCNFHQSYESSHKLNASIRIPVIVQHHSYLEPRVDTPWNHHFHSRCLLNLKLRQQKSVITLLRTVEKRKRGSETEVGGRGNIAVKKSADITCAVLFVSTQPSPLFLSSLKQLFPHTFMVWLCTSSLLIRTTTHSSTARASSDCRLMLNNPVKGAALSPHVLHLDQPPVSIHWLCFYKCWIKCGGMVQSTVSCL